MIKQLLQVGEFMTLFGQKKTSIPARLCPETLSDLAIKLSREEHNEMEDAFSKPDELGIVNINRAELLDALCDKLYIDLGNAHRFGLAMILPVAFRRVHESNMSKLWTDEEVADKQQLSKAGITSWSLVSSTGDRRWIAKNADGKVVKSPSYQPANLQDLLDELDGQDLLDLKHAERIIYAEEPEEGYDEDLDS